MMKSCKQVNVRVGDLRRWSTKGVIYVVLTPHVWKDSLSEQHRYWDVFELGGMNRPGEYQDNDVASDTLISRGIDDET